ncbi:hypothetical protein MED121_10884 [Marinomonas sp. MED121]|uniref:hypothetical protein n=1 Tax=Marinomonas sp. MED121 TaxID=314277 RepID=UPI0000690C41|nr:hypothetical protein [Marinomonas sp. MED121]EAQ64863.1 hypothetical protein MED121_10884 [Marinomonas sp. MED121]
MIAWLLISIFAFLPVLLGFYCHHKKSISKFFFNQVIIERKPRRIIFLRSEKNKFNIIFFISIALLLFYSINLFFNFYFEYKKQYYILFFIISLALIIYAFSSELAYILSNKIYTFSFSIITIFSTPILYLYFNSQFAFEIAIRTKESPTLFPYAINIATFLMVTSVIVSITTIIVILVIFYNFLKHIFTDSYKTLIKGFCMFSFIFNYIFFSEIFLKYLELNGLEKILKDTSFIAVEERCGFNNEKNTWLSYLGGGNISVLTLDESGNYHFKSRPCEPKGSSSESKK